MEEMDGDFLVIGTRAQGGEPETPAVAANDAEKRQIMVMVTSNCMVHGDEDLGAKLAVNFLKTLKEMGDELWRLVFLNSGVKLTVRGSEVLSDLKQLEEDGVTVLVRGNCPAHFNLLDQKQV